MKLRLQTKLSTNSASLIDVMHQRGLCVSYDRLKTFSIYLANCIISFWEKKGVVVPPQAVKGVFTTGAFDNIDHNPFSTTASSSLDGTCISLLQHHSSAYHPLEPLSNLFDPSDTGKSQVKPLPVAYTAIDLDISLKNSETLHIPVLRTNSHPWPASRPVQNTIENAFLWLEYVSQSLQKDDLAVGEWISWAGYYAENKRLIAAAEVNICLIKTMSMEVYATEI
jgi:hypothetical protein